MPDSPKKIAGKLKAITDAWATLRPGKSFGGMTLDEFKAALKPSWDERKEIAGLEIDLLAAQDRRNDADKESLRLALLVVNGVKGDREEGEDGGLYEAMGYVRKSERKTGKTNKTKKLKPGGG